MGSSANMSHPPAGSPIWREGCCCNTLAGFRGWESKVDSPVVGIVMGSDSDWEVMQHAARQLESLSIPFEARVVSAHRTPDEMFAYAETAASRGLRCIIAGAGGAAHLPGMLAAKTNLPSWRSGTEPIPQRSDSLLSIVQMPKGVPVATFAIGEAGAANAGLFAAALLGVTDPQIAARLAAFRDSQEAAVRAMRLPPAKP
jgi:5-(carboxyamino)imidazole ribonucleotide mutase